MENIDLGYYIPATTEDDLHFHPNAVEIDGKSIDAIPKPISPKKVEFYDEPLPPLNINKNPVSPVIGTPAEHSSPNISPSPPASPYVAYHPNRNSLTPSPSPLSSSPPTSHSTATAERIARHRSSRQVENPYLLLQQFDTVFIIDDSASMFGHNWQEVLEALKTLTRTAFEYTRGYSSGFDLLFLNSWQYNAVQVKTVEEIVSTFKQVVPHGVTPTANVLDGVLRGYLDQFYEMRDRRQAEGLPYSGGRAWEALKPLNVVILTDGEPTDEPEDVIVAIARELDRLNAPLSQVGIQFVQIGDDEHVTEYLEALDDALSKEYQIRDIVDTTPYTGKDLTGDELLKILLGAVNKRLDRQKNQRSGSRREERRDSRHGSTW
ncbi:hypothetical protein BJ508DRAFT_203041 [Ascobolus immersus RN42]|uniref:VWFA domain-containing protein n=1 Tax=Ascobolus immersus RN42 TaxID=1160509 RepID=A0A3N4IUC8_ASCIM|nr:hypothetical protein BJ508DRAFT_203041 [Ascobolus immersus RN42]